MRRVKFWDSRKHIIKNNTHTHSKSELIVFAPWNSFQQAPQCALGIDQGLWTTSVIQVSIIFAQGWVFGLETGQRACQQLPKAGSHINMWCQTIKLICYSDSIMWLKLKGSAISIGEMSLLCFEQHLFILAHVTNQSRRLSVNMWNWTFSAVIHEVLRRFFQSFVLLY